jgi:hypothetical protein
MLSYERLSFKIFFWWWNFSILRFERKKIDNFLLSVEILNLRGSIILKTKSLDWNGGFFVFQINKTCWNWNQRFSWKVRTEQPFGLFDRWSGDQWGRGLWKDCGGSEWTTQTQGEKGIGFGLPRSRRSVMLKS